MPHEQPAQADSSGLRRVRCAILFADLVESVWHYRQDEARTIGQWRRFAERARTTWVPAAGGRVVRTDGDGLLIECPDAVRAAACAFALHEGIAEIEDGAALVTGSAAHMQLRVGFHVGEVTFDDREAYGVGVNLAQRVASLSQPGQTLASAAARDGLVDRVHADVEDLGVRYVKHDEPVRTFRLTPPGPGPATAGVSPSARAREQPRPTLAVVPFAAQGDGGGQDALGHAVADDIIAALSRHPGLRVVSRLSTAAFRAVDADLSGLRPLLGAGFVLSGRYLLHDDRMRLNLELAETQHGEVLWADTAHAQVQAIFEGTDDLVPQVVREVTRRIAAHELARVRSLPVDTLESYTLYLGAEGLVSSLVRDDFMRGREVLQHLAERHPRQAAPHAMLAKWHVNHIVQDWTADEAVDRRRGADHAARALDIDGDSAPALSAAGLVHLNLKGDLDGARRLLLRALDLDPQNAATWAWVSAIHAYSGVPDAARSCSQRALALSPLDPDRFLFEAYAAMADIAAGDAAAAVAHARQSLRLNVLHSPSHRLLVGALGLAGRAEQARAAARRWLELFPLAYAGTRSARGPQPDEAWQARFADALRDAGVPPVAQPPGLTH